MIDNCKTIVISLIIILGITSCDQEEKVSLICPTNTNTLFSLISPEVTNIDIQNTLNYTEEFNTYTYRNFYNGGGVAVGDVNNDGLSDVFFCGNMVSNRLYLNRGDFQFEDVTEKSGLSTKDVWSTGVSMADVNGDGWLDIYICKSGKPEGKRRYNELFINNGKGDIPLFQEMASDYGVDDYGLSTHAAFLDYDKDGDLDMYLLNNSLRSVGHYDLRPGQREIPDPHGGNKLYRNDGEKFTDVAAEAGIYSSAIGFGLGVSVGDVNRDGWPDIFVSNDFFERDYLYFNNQDGTFSESLEEVMGEISLGSMGADIADLTNDGFPEIFVTEMLPEKEERLKTTAIFENWDKYQRNVDAGYFHQFPRNALQLNSGHTDSNGNIVMKEISRYAGVEATDWSWGALIADLDNDGYKDLFVANGIYKDLTDLDYINFYSDPTTTKRLMDEKGGFLLDMIDSMPSNPLPNYVFKNNGDLTFTPSSETWGFDCPSFSNGSAYGDLDNDGDLDLVVNNVNMPAFIYKNNASTLLKNNYLDIRLKGDGRNPFAVGAQVTLYSDEYQFYQELAPMRGYQSSVDYRLHFGLGKLSEIDSVQILWPDLQQQTILHPEINQLLQITKETTGKAIQNVNISPQKHNTIFTVEDKWEDIIYNKSEFVDFKRSPMLFHMSSAEGNRIATGDIDNNGADDIVFPGSKAQASTIYFQERNGIFQIKSQALLESDKSGRVISSLLFDVDNDGDLDLYEAHGGNEFPTSSSSLVDHLYFNNGRGIFDKEERIIPDNKYENTSTVVPADYDNDGDSDLFIGIRSVPFQYGVACNGYLMINDGRGNFTNANESLAPDLYNLGMITDAVWTDTDMDGDKDLIIAGQWMPLILFVNENGKLIKYQEDNGFTTNYGFWNRLAIADLDNDGDNDIIAGNHGLNTRFRASSEQPLKMYVNDFDRNGMIEQIIAITKDGKEYPFAGLSDVVTQLPYLRKKYLKYKSFKEKTITDIFTTEQIDQSIQWQVTETASTVFLNEGNNQFRKILLPTMGQLSPVYAIHIGDYTNDNIPDLLVGGNFHWSKPEAGIYDAMALCLLEGNGDGSFNGVSEQESGINVSGEIRDIQACNSPNGTIIVVSRINQNPVILKPVK